MPDKRIPALAAIDAIADGDLTAVYDASATTEDKKATAAQWASYMQTALNPAAAGHTHRGTTINTQSGTTYTFTAADIDAMVTFDNPNPVTVTLPSTTTVGWLRGDQINVVQLGAGQVTLVAGSGVTILTTDTLALQDQYSAATLTCLSANTWLIVGRLVPA